TSVLTRLFYWSSPSYTAIYTLALHDALPILCGVVGGQSLRPRPLLINDDHPIVAGQRHRHRVAMGVKKNDNHPPRIPVGMLPQRSEEHTSELQSRENLVCRLPLETKKNQPPA